MQKLQYFTYKLILSYRGTNYHGWQNQTTQPETVQNHVEKVIAKIAKYQDFQVIGASRTDSGVHAYGQVLKVILPREITPSKLTMGMNSKLPNDIRVVSCDFCEKSLNVNRDSLFKEYHYYFTTQESENSISSDILYPYPDQLNLELMQKACSVIMGEHNFHSFSYPGPKPPKPYREILHCSIEKAPLLNLSHDIYCFKIKGTGFLRHMVRYLMGAIWDIGANELLLDDLILSLSSGEKHGIRTKAPARGLHLFHIQY